jgi:NAD(P)-dependent dehydrogenase (short-subunit alcohol dehydrogenase family)
MAARCPHPAPRLELQTQVSFTGNSMYDATKRGIEGLAESVAQEVA